MKCESCNGPAIGKGFFKRIAHRRNCERIRRLGLIFPKIIIPGVFDRCPLCKENPSDTPLLCEECDRELGEIEKASG